MQDFRKLRVWHRAQEACVRVYLLTADFPDEERYGLTAQLRKAAVSVGANIAEGCKRSSKTDKGRLLNIAQGSAAEIMSELDVAVRLKYQHADETTALIQEYDEIGAMINALRKSVLGAS
jgi:four helix bundle protein